jgi:hypothetical protein
MKYTLTTFALFFVCLLNAQDTIVRIDSTRVIADIVSISDKTISYKRYSSPEGPVYEISRRHVARIAYADGTHETYGRTANEQYISTKPNVISITTTDVVAGVITINYERMIGDRLGIRAIGSMGVLGTTGKSPNSYTSSYYYNRYKLFSAGLDIHYYAYRGRNVSYYAGALMEFGRVRRAPYYWDFPPFPGNLSTIQDYYFGGFANGLTFHASGNVDIDLYCSLGWRHMMSGNGWSDYAARFGFSVGYRF